MFKITRAEQLTSNIYLMDVVAPRVAKSCKPGQFIIVRLDETAERIPLTICDYDAEAGTVTIVFQPVGASTHKMTSLKAGDYFMDFVGPLGCPSEFTKEDIAELKNKKILFVAGGVGTAPVYPQVKWLHENGVDADVIVGAKNHDLLILEDEMKAVAGNLYVTTDDGSYGTKGYVSTVVDELTKEYSFDAIYSCGAPGMLKYVDQKFENHPHAYLSMESRMACGMGACYACVVHLRNAKEAALSHCCPF